MKINENYQNKFNLKLNYLKNHMKFLKEENGVYSFITNNSILELNSSQIRFFNYFTHYWITNWDLFDKEQKITILSKYNNYNFEDIIPKGLYDTIRPMCPNHGYFITRPYDIINSKNDLCKWCDGIIEKDDDTTRSLDFKLNKIFRFKEK